MDTKRTCPGCQKPLAPNAPDGLCPACLMKAGLGTGVDIGADSQAESGRTPFVVPTPAEVARLFPQLEILGFIGQGGMGAVYKARQKELDRVVALKILPPGIGTDPAFAERFTREAKALAKLNHPGIVTLYEFGKTDGLFFFLMEFVDGMSLRHLLEVERISAREALAIVPQICDALQYAHDQGIVHRDIKPENILLDRQGRVKVADFGLAKLAEIDAGAVPHTPALSPCGCERNAVLTKAGKVMGTPQYMAPEQREHPTEVDHRADIYSLGVVFYQMLTGELPGKPIEAPSHKVQIDLRLDEVVLRALEKEPERRYQQASQVKSDVETIATEAQPAARSQHSLFVHREGRRQIHLPGVVLTVSSAGLILIGSVLLIGLGLWISSAPIRLAFSSIALFLLLYLAVVCAIMHAAARRVAKASSAGRPPSEAAPLWRRAVLIEALWALGAGILALLVVVGMVMLFGGFSKGGGLGSETGSHREKGQERAPVTTPETHSAVRVYTVNKKVSEFPAAEDLSTPEAAYATFNRLAASPDNAGWRRLSTKRVAERIPADSRKAELPANYARALLSAEILEVFVFEERLAKVCALMPPLGKAVEEGIDTRALELQDGVWKNAGNEVVGSLEEARGRFDRWLAWERAERKSRERPPVADPEIHLRPFVEFLRRESADPREFVLRALARHLVVILGEVHNRPRYWAFNKALVRSPDFAREAGVIYLEFPFTDQPLMDRFLAAPTNDPLPVVEMLRNMFEMGWPDQPTVEFCQAVWEVNQSLPRERRLRIVLVDMARPWKEIQKREDWRKYNMDRDRLMADNIVRDLKEHADDPRHALFITGWMHAVKKVTMPDGEPILRSAAWHLSGGMGISEVFTVFPHCPVMANQGEVGGRIALGLFESAFAALTNRPIAFPLDHGPFGREVFDAALGYVTGDSFSAGFDAYLYLGRLEDEIMSPLVPGFYSDEYASEVDRRLRMLKGGGLAQADGKSLEALRAQWWGQPRYAWRNLGPMDAWHYGGAWEEKFREAKHRDALQEAPAIKEAARRLVDAIRKADYVNPGDWELFPAPNAGYRVATDYPGWMNWICRRFRENPIVQVELGEVTLLPDGRPQLPYVLTLKDGAKLEGSLPFEWSARGQGWIGVEGLDWHRGQPSD